jgi:hypothetical protein
LTTTQAQAVSRLESATIDASLYAKGGIYYVVWTVEGGIGHGLHHLTSHVSRSLRHIPAFDHLQEVQTVRTTDVSQPRIEDPRATSYRFILFGQSMYVIASILAFIGLAIAYKALIRDQSRSSVWTVEPPTIG